MEKKIWNLIILDASGSMGSIQRAAVEGVQRTISAIRESQQSQPDMHQYLTLIDFSENVKVHYQSAPIEQVRDFTPQDYRLRGCTALYDAVGNALADMRKKVDGLDRALVTIITDGYENASKIYTGAQIKAIIDELTARDWVFTFIGTDNIDVERVSQSMGIKNSWAFAHDEQSTRMMFEKERRCRMAWNAKVSKGERAMEGFFNEEPHTVMEQDRITPDRIDALVPGEIFVFGSDITGSHGGGAARAAVHRFGAVVGVGEGPQGQSYAIPTTGLSSQGMMAAIQRFVDYARRHPELRFLVTPIGCGNAGYPVHLVASMFASAIDVQNISLPAMFWRELKR